MGLLDLFGQPSDHRTPDHDGSAVEIEHEALVGEPLAGTGISDGEERRSMTDPEDAPEAHPDALKVARCEMLLDTPREGVEQQLDADVR